MPFLQVQAHLALLNMNGTLICLASIFGMEGSGLKTLDNEEERRALEGLLDAFGSVFSLEEIASAYCKAGCDADLAGAVLHDLQDSTSNSSTQVPNSLIKSENSSESSHSNICEKSSHAEWNSKASKPRNRPVSAGTFSSVLGKGYINPISVANESCTATKPLKLDSKDFPVSELWSEESLNFVKDKSMNHDIEDFLFKMLGDGFQLDRDTIRKVLGCCGYDMQKSMETLLDLSAVTLEKRDNFFGVSTKESKDTCPRLESHSSVRGNMNWVSKANGSESTREQKERNDLQQEVLSSLFHVPERSKEFPGRTGAVNVEKRSKASGQVVVECLRDNIVESKTGNINPAKHLEEDDEGDSYLALRRAVKEYRATMKEYYKSAVEAFATGDLVRAGKLLEEGQFFNRKAREADEESVRIIFEARNEETEDALSLDLHNQGAKEAIRLLKCHLSSLSGIPSIQYLKVIVETDDEEKSKGARKRLIIKLLEKESITWIEGGNPGIILIRLDEVNPKRLSFARK